MPSRADWTRHAGRLRRVAGDVLDLVLPRSCLHCEQPCDGTFCPNCEAELRVNADRPRCGACGKPVLPVADACGSCHGRGHSPAAGLEVVGVLEGPLHALVKQNKFGGRWWCGEVLAELLWERPAVRRAVFAADVLCPVPLHRTRELGRGYNQAATIARRLGKLGGVPLAWPVRRARMTPPQAEEPDVRRRAENLRRAFAPADPLSVKGKSVVLVDDVVTSGATLRAFGRCVWRCRTAEMSALAAAVARPGGWDRMRPVIDAASRPTTAPAGDLR